MNSSYNFHESVTLELLTPQLQSLIFGQIPNLKALQALLWNSPRCTNTIRQTMTLELLPPELQALILQQTSNLKELHTFLASSPRLLQVFLDNRAAILSQVARNHITPSLLPLAVAALEQHRQRGPKLDRNAVLAFSDDLCQPGFPAIPRVFPLETSKELLQFHNCIERFVLDFAESRLQIIESCISNLKIKTPFAQRSQSSLSPVEYQRIARGFYHMDIYGHLFHRENDDPSPPFTPAEQAALFLQGLNEWELEEFLCVRTYLLEKLTGFLNSVEDDCLREFKNNEPYQIERTANGRWDNDDFFFSESNFDQNGWIEGCLTRGLRKIEGMLTATSFPDKLAALGQTAWMPWMEQSNISHAMSAISTYPNTATIASSTQTVSVDDIESCNGAWRWTWTGLGSWRPLPNLWQVKRLKGQRIWGFVMWDTQRLQKLRVLTKDPLIISNSCLKFPQVERNAMSVERRTRAQEEIWDRAGLILPENRNVNSFGWLNLEKTDQGIVVPPNY